MEDELLDDPIKTAPAREPEPEPEPEPVDMGPRIEAAVEMLARIGWVDAREVPVAFDDRITTRIVDFANALADQTLPKSTRRIWSAPGRLHFTRSTPERGEVGVSIRSDGLMRLFSISSTFAPARFLHRPYDENVALALLAKADRSTLGEEVEQSVDTGLVDTED